MIGGVWILIDSGGILRVADLEGSCLQLLPGFVVAG
jgi:hypothetical protein